LPFYLQAALSYTDDAWNNLEVDLRTKMPSYTILNLAAGIGRGNWSADLFIDNATDERAQIVRYDANYFDPYNSIFQDSTIGVNRPRTWGVRYTQRF
jgi:outer membrane receptor protein involved in Fe transport